MAKLSFVRRTWFLVLIGGLALFLATDWALSTTSNANYVPTVILIGAFLVPVTFVVYTYQRVPVGEIPLPDVAITFLWGGALGSVVAGYLEYETARHLPVLLMIGVGLIEEAAKLVFPLVFYFQCRCRFEDDGLLFGVTAGMGFAALETMGYAFVSLLQSRGNVDVLHQTLLIRGLLSPAGHAAWTGMICAVLWRERERIGHAVLNWAVIGAFVLAALLHSLWDIFGSISSVLGPGFAIFDFLGLIVIGGVSLWLLIRRMREAARTRPVSQAVNSKIA